MANLTREDARLANVARQKRVRGEVPTREESAALRRALKAAEERARWEHYGSCPKGDYVKMSGRQVKVLNEQAHRYNLPIGGRTVDLGAVIRAFHDFLSQNARRLNDPDEDFTLVAASKTPGARRLVAAQAQLKELELRTRAGDLIERVEVNELLTVVASHLRDAMGKLEKRYGSDAADVLEVALRSAEERVAGSEEGKPRTTETRRHGEVEGKGAGTETRDPSKGKGRAGKGSSAKGAKKGRG